MSRKKGQSHGSKESEGKAAAVQGCGPAPRAPAKLGTVPCGWQEPVALRGTGPFLHPAPPFKLGSRVPMRNSRTVTIMKPK